MNFHGLLFALLLVFFTSSGYSRCLLEKGDLFDRFHFRHATKYYDPETGLCYYGERFYSPEHGRWINRDPIEEGDGPGLYLFLNNDGINKVDFLGMMEINEDFRGVEGVDGNAPGYQHYTEAYIKNPYAGHFNSLRLTEINRRELILMDGRCVELSSERYKYDLFLFMNDSIVDAQRYIEHNPDVVCYVEENRTSINGINYVIPNGFTYSKAEIHPDEYNVLLKAM